MGNSMEYELRELGKRLMKELCREYEETDGAVEYDMNNIELLAVMYVTGTAGEAFESVMDEVDECVRTRRWVFN